MDLDSELPPKPDARTGEPRPPKAPVWRPNEDASDHDIHGTPPAAPEGCAPTLQFYRLTREAQVKNGVAGFVLCGVLFTLGWWSRGHPAFSWLSWWYVWVALIAVGVLLGWLSSRTEISAGVDWLAIRRKWVDTYDLVAIQTILTATNACYVKMTDSTGQQIIERLIDIQRNRRLWDLVYNGVRHSIARGCVIGGPRVREIFPDYRRCG